jgi:hypothetical protein
MEYDTMMMDGESLGPSVKISAVSSWTYHCHSQTAADALASFRDVSTNRYYTLGR